MKCNNGETPTDVSGISFYRHAPLAGLPYLINCGRETRLGHGFQYQTDDPDHRVERCVLQLTLEGACTYTDLGTDNTRTLTPGDALLFTQPRDSFRVRTDPQSTTPLKILYIGFFGHSTPHLVDGIRSGDPVFHLSAQMQVFENFLTLLKKPGWQHRRLDAQSSAQAVWDLLAACAKSRQEDSSDDPCVTAAMDFMHQTIDRTSVALTADHLGISRMHLSRSFQQALQTPPGTWLRQQRLALAKKQLRMDNTAIADIARNCGFSSATAFIATFKQHFNQTPHQWRKSQTQT